MSPSSGVAKPARSSMSTADELPPPPVNGRTSFGRAGSSGSLPATSSNASTCYVGPFGHVGTDPEADPAAATVGEANYLLFCTIGGYGCGTHAVMRLNAMLDAVRCGLALGLRLPLSNICLTAMRAAQIMVRIPSPEGDASTNPSMRHKLLMTPPNIASPAHVCFRSFQRPRCSRRTEGSAVRHVSLVAHRALQAAGHVLM